MGQINFISTSSKVTTQDLAAAHERLKSVSATFNSRKHRFLALAQYDVNADGVITAEGAPYDKMRVWVDVNKV